jgi:hypothetical protein
MLPRAKRPDRAASSFLPRLLPKGKSAAHFGIMDKPVLFSLPIEPILDTPSPIVLPDLSKDMIAPSEKPSLIRLLQQGMLDAELLHCSTPHSRDRQPANSKAAEKNLAQAPAAAPTPINRDPTPEALPGATASELAAAPSTSVETTVADAASSDAIVPKPFKGFCEHGHRNSECKFCGGRAICEHGRRRRQCTTCRGSGICEHGKRKSRCKWCNGVGICEHLRLKSRCKECPQEMPQKDPTSKELATITKGLTSFPNESLTKLFMSIPQSVITALAPSVRINKVGRPPGPAKPSKPFAPKPKPTAQPKKRIASKGSKKSSVALASASLHIEATRTASGPQPVPLAKFDDVSAVPFRLICLPSCLHRFRNQITLAQQRCTNVFV